MALQGVGPDGPTSVTDVNTRLNEMDGRFTEIGTRMTLLELKLPDLPGHKIKAESAINNAYSKITALENNLKLVNMDVISLVIDEKIRTGTEMQAKGSGKGSQDFPRIRIQLQQTNT